MKENTYSEFIHANFFKIIISIFVLVVFIVYGYLYINRSESDTRDYSLDKNIEDNFVLPPEEGDKYLHFKDGNNVTVINYFSLDCPFCRKLFFEEKKYVELFGYKVNFLFRDKPLSSYPLSYEKALVKECIYLKNENSNEKYFQFTEEVFKNYKDSKSNDWLKEMALKYVTQTQLDECLQDEKLKQKIIGFRAKADASQIFWTPTIVLFKDGVEVERIEKVWPALYLKVLQKYTN